MPRKQGNAYLGNPLLKGPNVQIDYSKEDLEKYVRCANDPEYFLENYMKIVTLDHGPQLIQLYDFQREIIRSIGTNRFTICKIPRQSGKSTIMIGYILHAILFTNNYKCAILANKLKTATELMNRLKFAYESLPKWLQQGVIEWNKLSISLENGSKVIASSTSSSAVRGDSFNFLLLDEFAFVPPNIAEDFFSSVYPTISSGKTSKVVIVSTPNGMNAFYKLWKDAKAGRNNYRTVEAFWHQVPGRDQKWVAETKRSLQSERQWIAEYECEFLGSEDTLIRASKLSSLVHENPISQTVDGLNIYEPPMRNHIYTICVDVARGVGNDYHAFTIIDCSQMPYKVVGRFRNNTMPAMVLPNLLSVVGNKYNEAYVLVEINDIGQQVADILHDELEYENVATITVKGKKGQKVGEGFGGGRTQYGVKMSQQIKKTGCMVIKEMIEQDKLILNDFDLIAELSTYVAKGAGYEATQGYNDDLVASLVLFGWLSTQNYFKELVNTEIRQRLFEEKLKKLEEDLVPFGFLDSGEDDFSRDVAALSRETPVYEQIKEQRLTKADFDEW